MCSTHVIVHRLQYAARVIYITGVFLFDISAGFRIVVICLTRTIIIYCLAFDT